MAQRLDNCIRGLYRCLRSLGLINVSKASFLGRFALPWSLLYVVTRLRVNLGGSTWGVMTITNREGFFISLTMSEQLDFNPDGKVICYGKYRCVAFLSTAIEKEEI